MATDSRWIPLVVCTLAAAVGGGCSRPAHNDRPTAEWVLKQGGTVTVREAGKAVKDPRALPSGGFVLEAINLNQTKVRDKDLKHVAEATSLQVLGLYGTDVTDRGLDQLLSIGSLQELELSYTQITDKGLEKLTRLPNLKKLYLTGTRVTDEGVASFRKHRPQCQVFRF